MKYRKEKKWTQARLAEALGVSFQAVSKWENGVSLPETQLLPTIAACLNISCDTLLGYSPSLTVSNIYEGLYQSPEYYWGTQPTALSIKVLSYFPPLSNPTVLDLGSREGQNVLFFARNGYRATGIEISSSGTKKGEALARRWNVQAQFIHASITDYQIKQDFDIIFCDDVLHMVPKEARLSLIHECKRHTAPGGIHVINVPVKKPFIEEQKKQRRYPWLSGELFTLYADWKILECCETEPMIINKNLRPQIYNYVVAQKVM